ncbi:AbrB/MazE/SpoVT family DNA-binding domain-containing protein [Candidatus Woesearchaeota archaeon]|nr:AbrB/MazE/SpoVT family DNA-binding domain-containing protein [Candidatus Woesearchaeota archaeon]
MVNIKRKVIQIANSTQLISLPRKWSQKYGIKKGDEIEVEENGSKLVIETERSQESGNIEVDITGADRDFLLFLIRSLYIKGYNEIKLVFNDPLIDHHRLNKKVTVISEVHIEMNRLTGIEVIQQHENFCILKVISESSIKDFDVILRRLFLLVNDASDDLVNGVIKNDKYLIGTLEEKHNTITKFMASGLRLLNKYGHPDHKNTVLYWLIIECLDNITDILKENARDILKLNIKISKNCENILRRIHQSLIYYYDFFYKFDLKLVEKISTERYGILEDIKKLSKKMSQNELILVTSMERIIEQILDMKVARIGMQY